MNRAKKIAGFLFALAMIIGLMLGMSVTVMADNNYLTFTGTEHFSIETHEYNNTHQHWNGTLEYSTDASTWQTWDGTTIHSVNNVLYLRGTGNTKITGGTDAFEKRWTINSQNQGTVSCSGNIMTLLDHNDPGNTILSDYCFANLFEGCTSLVEAPVLPAETLSDECYDSMLKGCTSLIAAPELPATTLADYCYNSMFSGCTSLVIPPDLPAKRLEDGCYSNMFDGCTSLVAAPTLPATKLKIYCYQDMFNGCTSLVIPPTLPATMLAIGCYSNMFSGCTSLVIPPDLPAETLNEVCYSNMFYGCTSLVIPPDLPATTLPNYCYEEMFSGCTSLKFSTTRAEPYNVEYRIPTSGDGSLSTNSIKDMFGNTGGTFMGTPTINTTYYRPGYSVSLTGGKNATASGGAETQTALKREMTTVTYTADSGYYFAEFGDIIKDNVIVKRISDTVVTVSGIPTAYVEITVPDAISAKVPFTDPGQKYASSLDNFAPIASSGKIKELVLDFSKVKESSVNPSDLKMTVIKGSKLTTREKVKDKNSVKTTGGIKAKFNKKDGTVTITCKENGTAALTMEDDVTYTITFTVQKPKAQKSGKRMNKGGSKAVKTIKDLFGTDIDAGDHTVPKQKHSQATISDNSLYIDPKEKDSIKVQYKYLDKKYKITVKVK